MNHLEYDNDKKRGRNHDWEEPAESRMGVPSKLLEQKKELIRIWSVLRAAELNLNDLAELLNHIDIHLFQNFRHQSKQWLCRKYSTAVAASFGIISSSDADTGGYEEIDLSAELIPDPDRTILLEVTGNSMRDDGIFPGSLLVVETPDEQRQPWFQPNDRQYVIALINGSDLTIKQFRKVGLDCYLVPRNRKNAQIKPILIQQTEDTEGEKVKILGIVRSVIRRF